jgi:hypothetical protein
MSSVETDSWGNPEDRLEKAKAWLGVARDLVKDDPDFDDLEGYLDASELLVCISPECADEFARMAHARSQAIVTLGFDPLNIQVGMMPLAIERLLESLTESEA